MQNDSSDLSWDEFDEMRDPRPAENGFDAVVDRAISRRGFLGGALALQMPPVYASGAAVYASRHARANRNSDIRLDTVANINHRSLCHN